MDFKKKALVILLVIFATLPVIQTAHAQVKFNPPPIAIGGLIVGYVLPSPLCATPHSLVFDYKTKAFYGLYPTSDSKIYLKGKIVIPGTFVLGSYTPLPAPCTLPYLVVPISKLGTS